jgi:hypothetical protein
MDEYADKFSEGGRNMRQEAEGLRGRFLTLWMDFEVGLDNIIGEYLEVPECRWDDMVFGLLPLLPAGKKVGFLQIIVKSVDPESDAHSLTHQALVFRNALAHHRAPIAVRSEFLVADHIPTVVYKNGEARVVSIDGDHALRVLEMAQTSVHRLLVKARPDYYERMKARAERWYPRDDEPE